MNVVNDLLFTNFSEQRDREQREKEQREKEQRELLEKEERDRHFAQMYAAEVQRSLFLSGMSHSQYQQAATQRSAHGMGMALGYPPGLSSHMTHPFGHIAAMAGFPSLNHTSPMSSSYNLTHTSPNVPPNSLNMSHSRNSTAPSPMNEGASKSRNTAPSPAHSSSNIPSVSAALSKHYLPPQKYADARKSNPMTPAAPHAHDAYNISHERQTNSSSNRHSSNHSSSNHSHANTESYKTLPTSVDQSYSLRDLPSKSLMYDPKADCKYSISLEKVKSKLVTSNEIHNEPMELSVSSDAPYAKFNVEQTSPRKQNASSDNKLKQTHFKNEELYNGCAARTDEAKDLSARYSSHVSQQPHSSDVTIMKVDKSGADANNAPKYTVDIQVIRSPENGTPGKEPFMTNSNSTSLEHDSTISSKDKPIANNNSKLSKETRAYSVLSKWNDSEVNPATEDSAKSSATSKSLPAAPQDFQPEELSNEKLISPTKSSTKPTESADTSNDSANISQTAAEITENDGTAVAGDAEGHNRIAKS